MADYVGMPQLHSPADGLSDSHTTLLHTSAGDASAGIMSFKEGDVLIITEQQDSGWWIADLNGATGVVPSTCARHGCQWPQLCP